MVLNKNHQTTMTFFGLLFVLGWCCISTFAFVVRHPDTSSSSLPSTFTKYDSDAVILTSKKNFQTMRRMTMNDVMDNTVSLQATSSSSSTSHETDELNNNNDKDGEKQQQQQQQVESTIVRAPLKLIGPYTCLALRFPNLATSTQRAKNVTTGVGLDFVLDTAANTNTINAQVAKELQLPIVGEALPGVASSGTIMGGDTFLLGDAELEGLSKSNSNATALNKDENDNDDDDNFTFIQNLTASTLPVASPTAAAGLLSWAFFYCFEGGVEFDWGSFNNNNKLKDGMMANPPSITFYGDAKNDYLQTKLNSMACATIDPIPITQLPSVTVKINGIEMPALLDTGSPITVLNSQAAQQAGLETVPLSESTNKSNNNRKGNGLNPFAAIANRFKEAQAMAEAAAKGDVLTIAGTNGRPTNLIKTSNPIELYVKGKKQSDNTNDGSDEKNDISLGTGHVYVGDIPGLAALNAIGVDSPPAVVLGMDALRRRPQMLVRPRENLVYFSKDDL